MWITSWWSTKFGSHFPQVTLHKKRKKTKKEVGGMLKLSEIFMDIENVSQSSVEQLKRDDWVDYETFKYLVHPFSGGSGALHLIHFTILEIPDWFATAWVSYKTTKVLSLCFDFFDELSRWLCILSISKIWLTKSLGLEILIGFVIHLLLNIPCIDSTFFPCQHCTLIVQQIPVKCNVQPIWFMWEPG